MKEGLFFFFLASQLYSIRCSVFGVNCVSFGLPFAYAMLGFFFLVSAIMGLCRERVAFYFFNFFEFL